MTTGRLHLVQAEEFWNLPGVRWNGPQHAAGTPVLSMAPEQGACLLGSGGSMIMTAVWSLPCLKELVVSIGIWPGGGSGGFHIKVCMYITQCIGFILVHPVFVRGKVYSFQVQTTSVECVCYLRYSFTGSIVPRQICSSGILFPNR